MDVANSIEILNYATWLRNGNAGKWLEGREMSKRMIKHKGCDDPDKQADGRCKWLQWYGEMGKTKREKKN